MIRPDARAQLQLALTRLLNDNDAQVPRASAKALATALDISVRAVYREAALLKTTTAAADDGTLAATPPVDPPRTNWWETDTARAEVTAALGGEPTVVAAWRTLARDGVVAVGYPAFTRQLERHLAPAVHAGLTAHGKKKGRDAYLEASLYCTEVTEGRNTRWQADVQHVPVRVRSATGTEVAQVFQITFLDEATRLVMATMFTFATPNQHDVAATLAAAVAGRVDAAGTFFGGLPESIRWDNGSEFLNEVVGHTCAVLGINPIPSPPYSGWRKGKIERFHLTMQQRFFSTLPGATQGPKSFTGKRPWRGADESLMFVDAFLAAALDGVAEYNEVHVHRALGMTPAQAWAADQAPIRRAPAAALHPLLLALPRHRVVAKDGISYKDVKYLSPTLKDFRRRKVEIRVLPHDTSRIYVFDPKQNGAFICEAVPAARLSVAERQRVLAARTAEYADIKQAINEGAARRAQRALINDVLDAEERAHRNRATPDAADQAVDTDENGHRPLGVDGDTFLDMYGDNE